MRRFYELSDGVEVSPIVCQHEYYDALEGEGYLAASLFSKDRKSGVIAAWVQSKGTHTLCRLLLSPYASNQSVIVSLALMPSGMSFALQYTVVLLGSALGICRDFDPWWTLLLGLCALWCYRAAPFVARRTEVQASAASSPGLVVRPANPPGRQPPR